MRTPDVFSWRTTEISSGRRVTLRPQRDPRRGRAGGARTLTILEMYSESSFEEFPGRFSADRRTPKKRRRGGAIFRGAGSRNLHQLEGVSDGRTGPRRRCKLRQPRISLGPEFFFEIISRRRLPRRSKNQMQFRVADRVGGGYRRGLLGRKS